MVIPLDWLVPGYQTVVWWSLVTFSEKGEEGHC